MYVHVILSELVGFFCLSLLDWTLSLYLFTLPLVYWNNFLFFILIQCPLWVSSNHRNRGVGLLVHTYIYVYAFSRNFFIQIDLQRRINIQATQRNSLLCSVGLYSLLLNFPLLCFFLCVLPTFLYTDFICSLVPFYLNGIDWFLSSFYVKYN